MSKLTTTMTGISALAVGALAAGFMLSPGTVPLTGDNRPLPAARQDADHPLAERVAALETALAAEQQARERLEDEFDAISARLDDADGDGGPLDAPMLAAEATEPATFQERVSRRGSSWDPEVRRQRLVDAGFAPSEAEEILRRETEIRMESLQQRYDARRNGERMPTRDSREILRDELGDDRYARYLEANGRPTSVTVSTVYEGSPALAAGLLPGDEILRYDGARVFSMNEISSMMYEGNAGEMITMDILRDGIPMQVSIPRGPLGVVGGRRFRR